MSTLHSYYRHHLLPLLLCNVFLILELASSLTTTTDVSTMSPIIMSASSTSLSLAPKIITISEKVWRKAASNHSNRVKSLLQPGLTPLDHKLNISKRKQMGPVDEWTALDPINPIYNFLIEYYGLKGLKGPRRLARWAPDPKLLMGMENNEDHVIGSSNTQSTSLSSSSEADNNSVYNAVMKASHGLGGILLENANLDDLGGTLHLRGSVPVPLHASAATTTIPNDNNNNDDPVEEQPLHGILYNPAVFYNRHLNIQTDDSDERRLQLMKTIAPFQWFTSILRTTIDSEPILHCYGLHEWAMQYHPEGADPPPSAKYQSNLKLRVSREVINEAVERKGVRCTHVDALRFFAPAAGPLNHHGSQLQRLDQLRLEQKGCVHAHMDLLKIGLKLHGFVDATLMEDILEIALEARKLDVEASPYDATEFGARIVPVETNEGRRLYRDEQIVLMQRAESVRERLLEAYEVFMKLAFDEDILLGGDKDCSSEDDEKATITADEGSMNHNNGEEKGPYIAPERLAKAEPGGLPWRKNLIEK